MIRKPWVFFPILIKITLKERTLIVVCPIWRNESFNDYYPLYAVRRILAQAYKVLHSRWSAVEVSLH